MATSTTRSRSRRAEQPASAPFGEASAWSRVGNGWRQIFGSFDRAGFSFEWHDFELESELDWARSFHPESVELCLNIVGDARIRSPQSECTMNAGSTAFYCCASDALRATRAPSQRHKFVTIEFSFAFLRQHLASHGSSLHGAIAPILTGKAVTDSVSSAGRLGSRQQQLLQALREPPVFAGAQPLWYQTKALELAAEFFFQPPDGNELFCHRQKRIASERTDKVIALLRRDLANPPSLEDIGRAVGCSPFYLSRTFSGETGKTIPQYLRQLRMERAAELLRTGKCNVTEAALQVGYSSLSHFSTAFHETFGCCPGLYPLKTQP